MKDLNRSEFNKEGNLMKIRVFDKNGIDEECDIFKMGGTDLYEGKPEDEKWVASEALDAFCDIPGTGCRIYDDKGTPYVYLVKDVTPGSVVDEYYDMEDVDKTCAEIALSCGSRPDVVSMVFKRLFTL